MGTQREETSLDETSPEQLASLLMLVIPAMIPPAVIATWTPREREEAELWAAAEYLSTSGNPAVLAPQPEFVRRAAEICTNPARAQLAVEAWMHHVAALEGSGEYITEAHASTVLAAMDAVTGLIVLLGDQGAEKASWQRRAMDTVGAYPEGVTAADLALLLGRTGPGQEALDKFLADGLELGVLSRSYGKWTKKETQP